MKNSAILVVTDPSSGHQYNVPITWSAGHDIDASVKVPPELLGLWRVAVNHLTKRYSPNTVFHPYPTLPYEVNISKLQTSATGAYVIANLLSFGKANWVTPPPYKQLVNVDIDKIMADEPEEPDTQREPLNLIRGQQDGQ